MERDSRRSERTLWNGGSRGRTFLWTIGDYWGIGGCGSTSSSCRTVSMMGSILTRVDADCDRAAGWWPDKLLNDNVAVVVARYPVRTALVDARGRMTYAALQMQVEQCALGLLGLGIRRGDVVTAQLPNWNEFVVLTLALERIGAVINPVAPIFRQRELRVMLQLASSVAVVIPARFRACDYPDMYAG